MTELARRTNRESVRTIGVLTNRLIVVRLRPA